jgi:hypothetical protein
MRKGFGFALVSPKKGALNKIDQALFPMLSSKQQRMKPTKNSPS